MFKRSRTLPPGWELRHGYIAGVYQIYDQDGWYRGNCAFGLRASRRQAWDYYEGKFPKPGTLVERGPSEQE